MSTGKKAWDHGKTRQQRGFDREYDKNRGLALARDGYRCKCPTCLKTGALKAAREVDHIVPRAEWLKRHGSFKGVNAMSNLRSVHPSCHAALTAQQRGFKPKQRIGLDGWPEDTP